MNQQQQFILTTELLAQAFGTTPKVISNNFNRHPEDFKEGIHYFLLEGDELKNFDILSERTSNIDILSERTSKGGARRKYLWTQKGAFAHAWILKSPGAKAAYEKLIELAEKPQTVGVSPEVYAALQNKYAAVARFAFEQKEVEHLDDSSLDDAQLDDIDRVLTRIQTLFSPSNQDATTEALLQEIKNLRNLIEHTQKQVEDADKQFVEQATLKAIVLSDDILALTTPHTNIPQIESPKSE